MSCRDEKLQLVCFTPSDGGPPVTLTLVRVFSGDGSIFASYYTDDTGLALDIDTYLGGGSVSECGESSCNIELTTSTVELSSAVFPVTFGGVAYDAEEHAELTAAIAASVCGVGTSTLVEPAE